MKKLKILIILILLVAVAIGISQLKKPEVLVNNEGEEIEVVLGNAEAKKDLIVVETPQPNAVLENTFEVKGQARGNWFFEASFPISLVASDGTVLLNSYIMTESEWMTEDFVPFAKTFSFQNPTGATSGTLILSKDNPSGLP
ncbi:MAG: Gmad2 immunoglobulin-like domain-containing protein, partial [Candidatus Paceibacterota bacterium]